MLTEFGKILIFLILAVVFVTITLFISKLIRPNKPTFEKLKVYECGENPEGSPWALTYKEYGFYGFAVGIIFLLVLGLGMAYEWRKGDLEWARPQPKVPILKELIKEEVEETVQN